MNFELPGIAWTVILLAVLAFLIAYLPDAPVYLLALGEAAAAALIRIIELLVKKQTEGEVEAMRGGEKGLLTRALFGG
jgi:hypothetical protein